MIKKVDHIAFAVKNLEEAKKRCESIYGGKFIIQKENKEGKYIMALYKVGENLFSFLEPTDPEGFVAKHIEAFGEGVQHIGVEVDSLNDFIKEVNEKGIKTHNFQETEGVRREVLVGPRSGFGVVMQVVEWLGTYREAGPEERMLKEHG